MAKLLRPHVPLEVRAQVLARQMLAAGVNVFAIASRQEGESIAALVKRRIEILFDGEKAHLDHDPALALREKVFRRGKHVGYKPDANDPDYLIYRTDADHDIKTRVRGDGAQYSDHALIRRKKKRDRKRKKMIRRRKKWPAKKIPQHKNPWPRKSSRRLPPRR